MRTLWLAHIAATLIMAGVIWFVQVVHYPLFRQVGDMAFAAYEESHTRLTTWVVAPCMLVEVGTMGLLLWYRPAALSALQLWTGAGLLAVIWLSTAFVQVPRHHALAHGFDPAAHRALVVSNWLRTIAWSLRGALVLWMTARLLTRL